MTMWHRLAARVQRVTVLRRLRENNSGLALLEFALSMPVVLSLGLYGVETSNLALMNLRLSQIALNLADNASRVGVTNSSASQQLREVDMNDVIQAARYQGKAIGLTTRGRITISSLESIAGVQRIHWQRCVGIQTGTNYDSSYGTTTTTAGTDTTITNLGTLTPLGMGDAGAMVNAPPNSGVMFIELNYLYHPLVGNFLFPDRRIHYIASFIVRDNRDFSQIFNPSPAATRMTCNLHTS